MSLSLLSNIIVPLSSMLIALLSLIVAVYALNSQQKHNENSVLPIILVEYADFEDDVSVSLSNRGVGPGIIDKVTITPGNGENLLFLFTDTDFYWTTFFAQIEGVVISPGASLHILRKEEPTEDQLRVIRSRLSKVHIYIEYHDIYKRPHKTNRSLEFFARRV